MTLTKKQTTITNCNCNDQFVGASFSSHLNLAIFFTTDCSSTTDCICAVSQCPVLSDVRESLLHITSVKLWIARATLLLSIVFGYVHYWYDVNVWTISLGFHHFLTTPTQAVTTSWRWFSRSTPYHMVCLHFILLCCSSEKSQMQNISNIVKVNIAFVSKLSNKMLIMIMQISLKWTNKVRIVFTQR